MSSFGERRVTIVGAGLGGLSAAIALRRAGLDVHVYERAQELSEVGAGITLWRNALCVLEELGVAHAVRRVGLAASGGVIALADGRRLLETSRDELAELGDLSELLVFHRAELQRALYEQLPSECVSFGAECVGYENTTLGISAKFAGQPDVHASLLIGADGISSAIRRQIKGASETRYAGYCCWRAICPIPSDWCGILGEIWGVGDRFGVVRIPGDRLYWFAVASGPPRQSFTDAAAQKRALCQRFANYAFDVLKILDGTEADAIIFRDIVDYAPSRGWSDGAATLLGDSAHATTPNMGQGAAMAIESAMVLTRSLQRHPELAEALRCYERTRWPRTTNVTTSSRRMGSMAHWQNPIARGVRNALFANTPRSLQLRQLRQLVGYDAARAELAE